MLRFLRSTSHVALMLLSASVAGCTTTSTDAVPEMQLPDNFSTGSVKPIAGNPNVETWWRQLKDPVLDSIIARGMVDNITIEQARERLDIARIRGVLSGSAYYPQVQASATAMRMSDDNIIQRTTGTALGGNGSVTWLIDIFGEGRATRKEAAANFAAAAADVEFVRLAYLTDLMTTYIEYRYNIEAIAISKQNLSSFSKTLSLTKEMRAAGTANNLDVAQAQGLVDDARAQIPPLETDKQQAVNHIATLMGISSREAATMLKGKGSQPKFKKLPDAGVPADLLRNRPDVRREERLFAAAAARIGIATARLYPSLSLNGTVDITRLITAGLSPTTIPWAFGPSIVAPIFDGGRRRAEVDVAKAETRVQYLRWKDTVLRGVEEVENALVAIYHGREETAALMRKVSSYSTALSLARESYSGGTGLILDVLQADRSLGVARMDLADSLRRNTLNGVRLYIAIGSGAAVEVPETQTASLGPAPFPEPDTTVKTEPDPRPMRKTVHQRPAR